MAQIKCKMCGGSIEINDSSITTVCCDFCGQEQTIPKVDSDRKLTLYNRANAARSNNDFDTALRHFEAIILEFPDEAEAHWGICLSRYGIEYVDDPVKRKKIPTCHRTLMNSIFDDVNYKEAIEHADVVAKRLYQEEAEIIDRIQKNIIAISQREEPFDIFICYKETDELRNRTRDSAIAQTIYDELTQKGYKVFFARITLESKLGTQYEPIIYAALRSSKVMLVIGSKVEYFNAVWVKNEWSRFLSFMQEDSNKYLIPCYKDMEAYDMPAEFLALQAQDIDKLGFKQDLLRGIDKIFGRDVAVQQQAKPERIKQTTTQDYETLIQTMFELNHYDRAIDFCLKAIEEDTRNPYYWYMQGCAILKLDENRIHEARVSFKNCLKFGDDNDDQIYAPLIQEKFASFVKKDLKNEMDRILKSKITESAIVEVFLAIDKAVDKFFFKDIEDVKFNSEIIRKTKCEFYVENVKQVITKIKSQASNVLSAYQKQKSGSKKPSKDDAIKAVVGCKEIIDSLIKVQKLLKDANVNRKTDSIVLEIAELIVEACEVCVTFEGYKQVYNTTLKSYSSTLEYQMSNADKTKIKAIADEQTELIYEYNKNIKLPSIIKEFGSKVEYLKTCPIDSKNILTAINMYNMLFDKNNDLIKNRWLKDELPNYFPTIEAALLNVTAQFDERIATSEDAKEYDDVKSLIEKVKELSDDVFEKKNSKKEILDSLNDFLVRHEEFYLSKHPEIVEERRKAAETARCEKICRKADETLNRMFKFKSSFNETTYNRTIEDLRKISHHKPAGDLLTKYRTKYREYQRELEDERLRREAALQLQKEEQTEKIAKTICIIACVLYAIIVIVSTINGLTK